MFPIVWLGIVALSLGMTNDSHDALGQKLFIMSQVLTARREYTLSILCLQYPADYSQGRSCAEDAHIQIDTATCKQASNLLLSLLLVLTISGGAIRGSCSYHFLEYAGRPSQAGNEVIGSLDSAYTFPFLSKIPASYRLVI